ncbi:hypothetical protein JOD43_002272 [Pullulanibacillus pueri]|uniref:Uncharacterized protein n=1 Tax=Pullulanibacillus pueri TaxID=1437324 RepID=A0A8J2ZUQ6_9BACL|nr:hypothetical protein [Pullulanibacillus pueri]MBM7682099.1 hypothetical protein [Pullulanibacillus pueri]GGH79985.1 hypothetical protein GCM10007096_15720 [Pullulanibacillus pueri]
MSHQQELLLDQIRKLNHQIADLNAHYWKLYNNVDTWQFWLNAVFLIVPLIVLLIYIDRKRVFQILFFGYTIHVLMNDLDIVSVLKGLVYHPYSLIPIPQVHLAIDTSFIPVFFMLVYQYSLNHKKNVYVLGILASACTGFLLGFFTEKTNLLQMYQWMHLWVLFLVNILEFFIAHWLTHFFLLFYRRGNRTTTMS